MQEAVLLRRRLPQAPVAIASDRKCRARGAAQWRPKAHLPSAVAALLCNATLVQCDLLLEGLTPSPFPPAIAAQAHEHGLYHLLL